MNSSGNSTCSSYQNETNFFRVFQITSLTLVGGFGVFGNIFIIVLAAKYTARRNLHHLIVNMAVADTLVVLMTWGLYLPSLFDYHVWSSIKRDTAEVFCKFFSFLLSVGMWLCLVTLLVISIERFKATRQTLQRSRPYTLKQRLAVLACTWLSAIVLALHEWYAAYVYKEGNEYNCYLQSPSLPISVVIVIFSALSYCAIVSFSITTLLGLSNQQAIQNNLQEMQRQARAKRMASAMKMVLSSLFVFCSCYLPVDITGLLEIVDENSEDAFKSTCIDWNWFYFCVEFLPLVNSCFSPVIYIIFLADFQEAAKKKFSRKVNPLSAITMNSSSYTS